MDELNKAYSVWMASIQETNAAARRVGDAMIDIEDTADIEHELANYRRLREKEFGLFRDYKDMERRFMPF